MKIFEKYYFALITILLLAFIIRVWNISGLPSSLSPDEAALGYNSYSILKTGRDEFGNFLPIVFKSFGDYKPGLYVYLTVPFVYIFGLSEISVRLPSVIGGVLSVYLIYLIAMTLSESNKKLSLAVAFCASFNPWLIFFSRGAWEANVALTLTLAGIYFFLKSLRHFSYFVLCALFFGLTFVTYQGAKLSTAIVVLILVTIYRKTFLNKLRKNLATISVAILLVIVISAPILLSFFQGQTGRLKVFSVFSYPRPKEYLQNFLEESGVGIGSARYYLFYSENLNFTRGIMGRWFNHFSGKFLFFEGDYQNPRHSSPNHGMFLLADIFLIAIGAMFILNSKIINHNSKTFLLLWLLLSPLPAVLSRDQVQSVRALNMAVPLIFITGLGLYSILQYVSAIKPRIFLYFLFSLIYSLSFINFLDSYFVHYNVHNAKYTPFGFKEMVYKVNEIKSNYSRIVVQQSYSQPYIYFLFFGAKEGLVNPSEYQKKLTLVDGGIDVGQVSQLGETEFVGFSWPYANGQKNTLIVGNDVVVPENFGTESYSLVWEQKYPDGFSTAWRMVETK